MGSAAVLLNEVPMKTPRDPMGIYHPMGWRKSGKPMKNLCNGQEPLFCNLRQSLSLAHTDCIKYISIGGEAYSAPRSPVTNICRPTDPAFRALFLSRGVWKTSDAYGWHVIRLSD